MTVSAKKSENQIQIALSHYFDRRANILIPNVSWGFFSQMEVDLLVIRKSMWMEEVEIKTSKQDLLKDSSKRRHRIGNEIFFKKDFEVIRNKWFCVPEELKDHESIPAECGVLFFDKYLQINEFRKPAKNKDCRKITDQELIKLLRLGNLRVWSLREKMESKEESL